MGSFEKMVLRFALRHKASAYFKTWAAASLYEDYAALDKKLAAVLTAGETGDFTECQWVQCPEKNDEHALSVRRYQQMIDNAATVSRVAQTLLPLVTRLGNEDLKQMAQNVMFHATAANDNVKTMKLNIAAAGLLSLLQQKPRQASFEKDLKDCIQWVTGTLKVSLKDMPKYLRSTYAEATQKAAAGSTTPSSAAASSTTASSAASKSFSNSAKLLKGAKP